MSPLSIFAILLTALAAAPAASIRQLEQSTTTPTSSNASSTNTTTDLIVTACQHTSYYDLCKSSLQSHPKSQTADLKGLAAISIDVAITHAKDTISYLKRLARNTTDANDAFAAGCLGDCLTEYGDAVEDLVESKGALREGSYEDVNAKVSGAMTDSDTCEDGFGDRDGYTSPVTERSRQFLMLCSNSLAITSLLVV